VSDPTTVAVARPRDGVALITLNRPEKLNALNATMFDELTEAARAVSRDRSVRAVVLTGAGRAFCPGFDLADAPALAELTSGEMLDFQERAAGVVQAIHAVPQPVIAAIDGACVGGGLSIALAADIRIASDAAKLCAIFVRGGFSAGDLGCTWFLPRIVGLGVAAELITTARTVLADEALRIGLVSHVHPTDGLLDAALATAEAIATNAPLAVRMSLRALYANVDAPSLRTALELENRGQAMLSPGPDVREALAAAREGRRPDFQD
jgi:enoyl-CoA hydratase/carnithine racemase